MEKQECFVIPEDPNESMITVDPSRRSWFQRTFGTLEHGSLRLGIVTLINTAVGAGMLSLSAAVSHFGYFVGIAMFFVGAGNLYLGLYCFYFLMF